MQVDVVGTAGQGGQSQGACDAITQVFAILGKRWSGLIIVTLLGGPARFSELARGIPGLSERMLAERLGELTDAGLVEREIWGGPPVSVRYRLTARGQALQPALDELERWGQEQLVTRPTCGTERTPRRTARGRPELAEQPKRPGLAGKAEQEHKQERGVR